MVGITGPESGLDRAVGRERAEGGAGALREFLDSLDAAGRRECALALHLRVCRRTDEDLAGPALAALARQDLGWSAAEAELLLGRLLGRAAQVAPHELERSFLALVPVALAAAERSGGYDRPRIRVLRAAAERLRVFRNDRFAALRDRMDALLVSPVRVEPGLLPAHLLDGNDDFGPAMRAAHGPLLTGPGVVEFLGHCAEVGKGRATRSWRRRAAELLAGAGAGPEAVRLLLEGVVAQSEHRVADPNPWGTAVPTLASEGNTTLLRGVLWASLDLPARWVVPLVGAVALHAGTGLGGSGGVCRSQSLATAAVAVLGECGDGRGEEAAQWLGRLPGKVRNRTVARGITKALEAVAARSGVTPSMLRERGVATLGLDGRGIREVRLGAFTAELAVREPGAALLSFLDPEGRPLRSAPKEVRETRAGELAELRAELKRLKGLLASERARLEEQLTAGTTWPVDDWHRYCVDHPVTGAVARVLLWEVTEDGGARWTAGIPERTGGGWALAGADGTACPVGPGARLRLWHPVRAGGDEVAEWRAALPGGDGSRPFQQVFREVFAPSPEEAADGVSGRFAGRVLRYGRARALMTERGWSGNHLGYFRDGWSARMTRELPVPGEVPVAGATRWRAGLPVELVDEGPDADVTPRLCVTGPVRFDRGTGPAGARTAWTEAAVADVPPLLLSEALRDVALFVGVAEEEG
ncbi:DUF4132 domain-containing protein [Streptomyces sp. NPDC092359]|uniref:DUF4132 domain-containing protein n=1 Tax=Streptomyces sp. NPDC092359 TaxID=3366014 RepID=UPI00382AFD05